MKVLFAILISLSLTPKAEDIEVLPQFSHLRCVTKGNARAMISGTCGYEVDGGLKEDTNRIYCQLTTTQVGDSSSFMNSTNSSSKDTCYVLNTLNGVHLKRAGKMHWISDSSPQGVCLATYVTTLDSKNGIDWAYSETLASVGNDASHCSWVKADLGKRYDYSSANSNVYKVGCKYVEFGRRQGLNIFNY